MASPAMGAMAPGPAAMDASMAASYGDANVSALTGLVGAAPGTMVNDLNQSFVLTSAYLVFFMHCGFAMLSIGSVRSRFAKHISILILVDACMSALGYYLFGYAVSFGDKVVTGDDGTVTLAGNAFIGTQAVALHGVTGDKFFFWVFEWAFAATACTIVSGAICERSRLEAYMLYSFFMASWVYPIIVHSVWSPAGWASMFRNVPIAADLSVTNWGTLTSYLFGSGVIDYAGSGAVHMVGGYGALAGSFVLGPRIGRYLPDGSCVDMPGHNSSLFLLGVMILWFGWYGFNPGSQLAIVGYSSAVANAATTTTLAPAAAGISAFVIRAVASRVSTGKVHWDIMAMGNGALAGLACITAPCSVVYPWAAIIIGAISGSFYIVGSKVSILLHLDDPLDAIAVHAWGGTLGILLTGVFAAPQLVMNSYGMKLAADGTMEQRPYGFIMGGGGKLMLAQFVYALWVAGWVLVNMTIFFFILKAVGMLRVPANEETVGLDDSYHGGSAYPGGPEEVSDKSLRASGNGNAGVSKAEFDSLKAEVAALKKA